MATATTAATAANASRTGSDDIAALKALVADTLTKRGVLNRLKAELRSNVFAVLQDKQQSQLRPVNNEKLQALKQSREGRLALDMVSEFLEYYELVQSKPIYTAESGLPDAFEPSLRTIIAKEVHIGSADGRGLPEEPILMTLIRQAEQRKPFVPVPSALNVLATGGDARGALAAVSVKSPTETGASLRPSSPNQRVVPADAAETRPHNIDLLPVSGSGAAVDANSSLFLAKLATPQKQQTLATAKNEQSPSFATPPDQQLNSEKKASNLPPLSFMPKPTASPLTSIAAAPPLGGTTMLTSAQLEHSSSIEDVIEDIDVDIPEDLVMDDDDLVNAVSGGFGTSVSLANTTPPRFASPDEEDAAIGDIPLAGLDDDDVSFGHASTSKHANADAWL